MNYTPTQKLHHQLNNIKHWHLNYPTKHELIHSKPAPDSILRFSVSLPSNLPFGAENWLDEPHLGAEGAKTWPEMWDNLFSWLRAWENDTPTMLSDDWERLHYLVDLLAAYHEDDFYDYELTIDTIHRRMKSVMAAPIPGAPCLSYTRPMHKIMTLHGWEGGLYCRDCQRVTSMQAWEKDYLELLRSTDAWLPLEVIKQLFPGVKASTLRKWVQRGKLESRKSSNGVSLYQPCTVRALFTGKPAAA